MEKCGAGLVFGGEAFLGDEDIRGVVAVMVEAFGVPCDSGDAFAIEECGSFVEVAEAESGGAFGEERSKVVESLAGEGAELLVECGGLDKNEMG